MKSYEKSHDELRQIYKTCKHWKHCTYYDPPRGRYHMCIKCCRTLRHDFAGNLVIDENDITIYRETVKSVLIGENG